MKLKNLAYLSFALSSALNATPPQWELIPAESQLNFTATQNNAPVSGEFKRFTADLKVDVNDLKNSSIDIVIDINSLNASYGEVKTTLLTADWFNVKIFPKAEFKSAEFTKTGENAYSAKGNLTIRDKTVPVILNFTSSFPNENKGIVEGSTVIKRSAFGVGQGQWTSTEEIKDDVTVKFKVSATKK